MIVIFTTLFVGSLISLYLLLFGVLAYHLWEEISREQWDEVIWHASFLLCWIGLGSGIVLTVLLTH